MEELESLHSFTPWHKASETIGVSSMDIKRESLKISVKMLVVLFLHFRSTHSPLWPSLSWALRSSRPDDSALLTAQRQRTMAMLNRPIVFHFLALSCSMVQYWPTICVEQLKVNGWST